jgi:hypothetical protein
VAYNLATVARQLGGQRQGNNWSCPCPVCRYEGRTLSLGYGGNGKLLAHCHGDDCAYDDILASLVEYGLLDDDDADFAGRQIQIVRADEAKKIRRALRIFEGVAGVTGVDGRRYLHNRGITNIPPILKFGICPHRNGNSYFAMVAPFRDVDDQPTGYHATILTPDGSAKAPFPSKDLERECRGVVRGSTIRLFPHDPTCELAVGEGVETSLSAAELFDLPAWSAVSAGGLKTLLLPPDVRRVLLCADHDESGVGLRNAVAARARLQGEGRQVRIVMPPAVGADFNDVLMLRRRNA